MKDSFSGMPGYKSSEVVDGAITSIMPSFFNEDYYANFRVKRHIPDSHFPIRLIFEDDFDSGIHHTLYLSYSDDHDFFLIDKELDVFDKEILKFIVRFKAVQKYQLIKEFPHSKANLDKSLTKLVNYYLIDEFRFPRVDKEGEASTYVFNQTSSRFISYHHLLKQSEITNFTWKDWRESDDLQFIRFWKVTDTYQLMKDSKDYKSFSNHFSLSHKTVTINQNRKRFLPPLYLFGELRFTNWRNGKDYSFIPYSIVNDSDIDKLGIVFQHWAHLDNDAQYLFVIVDSEDVIRTIQDRYDVSSIDANILFLNLERVTNVDIMQAIYMVDRKEKNFCLLPFTLKFVEKR